jgi:hypothetical protein
MPPLPTIATRPLMVLDPDLDPPVLTGATPQGERKIVLINGGRFEGERLRGRVLAGGGDWALTRHDGVLELDVRLLLETDDGARIAVAYTGMRHGTADGLARMARGETVVAGEVYFRIQPRFECADERYAWLTRMLCIGIGERRPAGPRYHLFELL